MGFKNVFFYSIGPIGGALVSVFTLPVVARFFDSYAIGQLSMLQVIISLSVMILSLGLHQAYVREYHEEKDKTELFQLMVIPSFVAFIFVSVCIAIMPISISEYFFEIESEFGDLVLLLTILVYLMNNYFIYVIRMEEKALSYSLNQFLPKFVNLMLILFFSLASSVHDFKYLWASNVISGLVSLLLLIFLTRHVLLSCKLFFLDISKLKRMFGFSFPLIFSGFAYWGLTTLDRAFVKEYSSYSQLGIYSVAISFGGIGTILSSIFSNVWQPMVYRWASEDVYNKNFIISMNYITLGVAVVWSTFGCFAWVPKSIMPPEYSSIEAIFVGCIAVPLLYIISETTQIGISISRHSSFSLLATIGSLLCNIILNFILVPTHGAHGAAISSVISFFIFLILRTELSIYAWRQFSRWKIYLVAMLYSSMSITLNIYTIKPIGYCLIWILMGMGAVCLFKNEFKVVRNFVFNEILRLDNSR